MLNMFRVMRSPNESAGGGAETTTTSTAGSERVVVDAQDSSTESKNDLPEWAKKELEKARGEAAERRVKLREAEAKLEELSPLAQKHKELEDAQKSETDKLREQLEAMRLEAEKATAQAAQAQKEAKLTLLASKVGVGPELVALLDISKLDLENEKATTELLKTLAPRSSGGGPSNPSSTDAGKDSAADWYASYTGKRPSIFGG